MPNVLKMRVREERRERERMRMKCWVQLQPASQPLLLLKLFQIKSVNVLRQTQSCWQHRSGSSCLPQSCQAKDRRRGQVSVLAILGKKKNQQFSSQVSFTTQSRLVGLKPWILLSQLPKKGMAGGTIMPCPPITMILGKSFGSSFHFCSIRWKLWPSINFQCTRTSSFSKQNGLRHLTNHLQQIAIMPTVLTQCPHLSEAVGT